MPGQAFKLHMHIEHDESLSSTTTGHKLNVHVISTLHDTTHNTHHQDDFLNDHQEHYLTDITVTPDSFVKKMESFTLYMLVFLIISFLIIVPLIRSIFREPVQTKLTSTYNLLSPPLRAPPVHSPV